MSGKQWQAPDWMNAEDREREERLVQALRAVVTSARAAAERLERASDVTAWGWRMDAVCQEALERAASFDRLAPASTEGEAA